MRHLLIANPGPLSALMLVAGFVFIVIGGAPPAMAIGVILTLLAFLVPFIRLSFLPSAAQDTSALGDVPQTKRRLGDPDGPSSPLAP